MRIIKVSEIWIKNKLWHTSGSLRVEIVIYITYLLLLLN